MSNRIILCGIQIISFPESKNPSAESASLLMLYPIEIVDAPKFRRKSVGQSTETPFGKQSLAINAKYAHQLIDTGAFVSNKEYELVVGFNTDTFENEISEIIPVDQQLKQHFKDCLKGQ
ncbi:MAG: VSK-int [Colwellia sp.]|nr:MAG: VSK-int [Colwellia sp.]